MSAFSHQFVRPCMLGLTHHLRWIIRWLHCNKSRQTKQPFPRIDNFEIHHELGRGGGGTVFFATDLKHNRAVALKVPNPDRLCAESLQRFINEGCIANRFGDPNVVHVYKVSENPPYIAYEYIDGENLRTLLVRSRDQRLGFLEAASLAKTLAEIAQRFHDKRIIHRDIKLGNLFVDRRGKLYLGDCGTAFDLDRKPRLTKQEGRAQGTPEYMSPQQASGEFPSFKDDQYSVGVVLYTLLTGRTPFIGKWNIVLGNLIHRVPPSPRTLRNDIPEELEAIILTAMAREPSGRYPSCLDLAKALGKFIDSQSEGVVSPPPIVGGVSSGRQTRRFALTAAAVLVGASIWFGLWRFSQADPTPPESLLASQAGADGVAPAEDGTQGAGRREEPRNNAKQADPPQIDSGELKNAKEKLRAARMPVVIEEDVVRQILAWRNPASLKKSQFKTHAKQLYRRATGLSADVHCGTGTAWLGKSGNYQVFANQKAAPDIALAERQPHLVVFIPYDENGFGTPVVIEGNDNGWGYEYRTPDEISTTGYFLVAGP